MIFSCLGKHLPLIKLKLKKLDLMLLRVILCLDILLFSFPSLSHRGNATAWCQSRGVTRESQISTYAFFYPHLVFLHVVPLIITGFATSPELRKREGETYFLPLPAMRIDNRKQSQTEETCKQINEEEMRFTVIEPIPRNKSVQCCLCPASFRPVCTCGLMLILQDWFVCIQQWGTLHKQWTALQA